ncbi:MAG TPA: hypothetical protein VHB21_05280 [Minicystis sp.]|nr:hypothetical protein [Minicystis sp.]
MGFADVLKKVFAPRWPPADQDRLRLRLATSRAVLLAPLVRGRVGRDDDRIVALGEYEGRAAQLRIWLAFGTTEVRLATRRTLRSYVSLHYDVERDQYAGGPPPIVTDPKAKRWHDLSAHVGVHGDEREVAEAKARLEQLPQELVAPLVATMDAARYGYLRAGGDEVALSLDAPALLSKEAPRIFGEELARLARLADAIERAWP